MILKLIKNDSKTIVTWNKKVQNGPKTVQKIIFINFKFIKLIFFLQNWDFYSSVKVPKLRFLSKNLDNSKLIKAEVETFFSSKSDLCFQKHSRLPTITKQLNRTMRELNTQITVFENRKKVAFNIASESSYVYNLSGQKFI